MKFFSRQAPYWRGADNITIMMVRVLVALTPVLCVSVWFLGIGVLLNLIFAAAICLALEALTLRLRHRPVKPFLLDGSALVTAALIALTLPPLMPWWVTAIACLFAIVFAKHLYGGLGYNVFNPAMVGYVVVLISFPHYVAQWPATSAPADTTTLIAAFLHGVLPATGLVDAYSSATPLDSIKMQLGQMKTMQEIMVEPAFGWLAGRGWEWINLAALAGGLWLLRKKVIRWHIPAAMLGSMAFWYFALYALDSATHVSPLLGLFSGGTMLAAFFVATDPVSAATSERGRIIYGAGIGTLCFAMRQWGAYPDGIAFAVLLMNMAAPLIDRYTLPPVYGHSGRS
jgi:electron transport complex protein RnfD